MEGNRGRSRVRSLLHLLLLPCLLSSGVQGQDAPAKGQHGFRVSVNLVMVNLSVTDPQGKRHTDLREEDFEILENGVKQDVKFFQSVEAPFHVVLLVDTSGSTAPRLDLIRKAADRFLLRISPEDRVAIVDVAGRVEVLQGFTADRQILSRQLRRLGTTRENGTLLNDAILQVLQSVFRGIEGRKAVVFLSDGQDSGSRTRVADLAGAVYSSDAVLYGLLVDTREHLSKTMRRVEEEFARIVLVPEARSGSRVEQVKRAAVFLLERLPPSCEVSVIEHKSPRRATLLLPFTTDREKVKEEIAKAEFQPRVSNGPSNWMASGAMVLITDDGADLPNRIQMDIVRRARVLILGKKSDDEWQKDLGFLARNIPDPADLRAGLAELPTRYREARDRVAALCDHSGGRSYDLVGTADLDDFYGRVAEELRRTYSIGYYSHATSGQYNSLEVRLVSGKPANIRSRRGFILPREISRQD